MASELDDLGRLLEDYGGEGRPMIGVELEGLLHEIKIRLIQGSPTALLADEWSLRALASLVAEARANLDALISARVAGHEWQSDLDEFAGARAALQRLLNLIDGEPERGDFVFNPHPQTAILSEPTVAWEEQ